MDAANGKDKGKAARNVDSGRLAATLALDGPVDRVRGVSGGRASALAKMGIHSVRDLITHFPRRYLDMSRTCTIASAPIGEACTIVGQVFEVKVKRPKPRLSLTELTLVDGTSTLIITFFRQPWLADRLHAGDRLAVSGKVEFNYGFKRMTNPPSMEKLDGSDTANGIIIAMHPASEKLNTSMMRTVIGSAIDLCTGMDDPLPLSLRTRYRLVSRQTAFRDIHFPLTMDEAAAARRRLTYEEVLLLELHLMSRSQGAGGDGPSTRHTVDGPCQAALLDALPFALTDEQRQARADLLEGMASEKRIHHMLLGDVGTGKTAVAAFGLAAAADTGTQALMMAPTEVLATQYAQKLGPLMDASGISWGLLTGSTDASDRADLIERLSEGSLSVLFGTHALLEPDVRPKSCSLVVIDEQQRFGVDQRNALMAKGAAADVLSMTATPIPRSLALALYGDMTLSYIKHRPNPRAGTQTRVMARTQRGEAYDIAREALEAGHQVYVVCPLVGQVVDTEPKEGKAARESEDVDEYAYSSIQIEDEADLRDDDSKAAVKQAEYLREAVFPGYSVGILHGRMKSSEKQQAMQDFRDGTTDVLVATTVIEVGVDVPNATVMIIEEADRFGLAQLHQLRGRVGRGDTPGRVCLISGSKAPTALERLAAMEGTEDGFELAEYDLSLRREGDILGNRQHGASVLKLVNVVRDANIIETAHDDAAALLADDPGLALPEHRALRYEITRTFGRMVEESGRRV